MRGPVGSRCYKKPQFVVVGIWLLLWLVASQTSAQTPAVLASFNGSSNGAYPDAGLTLSGNTCTGRPTSAAPMGRAKSSAYPRAAALPRCWPRSTAATVHTPWGGLTSSGNTLYGTTEAGGANGDGEVFSVPVGGGSLHRAGGFLAPAAATAHIPMRA